MSIDLEDLPPEIQEAIHAYYQTAGAQVSGEVDPTEFSKIMGQTHYLLKDDNIDDLFSTDERIKKLRPALSHLIRTSRCDDKKSITRLKLQWRIACSLELLILPKKPASMGEFLAWLTYGYTVIEDMRNGWRGKLVTERIRSFKVETSAPKKKKFLGIF